MRTVDAAFLSHLQGEVTTLCHLIEIRRRDTVTYRFTTHDQNVPFDGNVYFSDSGISPSAVEFKITMSVNNLEITSFLNEANISEHDLIGGLFYRAQIKMRIVNWKDPTQGSMKTIRGWLGQVTRDGDKFVAEVRSLMQGLQQTIGSLISDRCRSDFGATGIGCDTGCSFPIDPPVWTPYTEFGDQPIGTGAVLQALANGHGLWDGGASGTKNLSIISGGRGYEDPDVTAFYTINGYPVKLSAITVQVTDGALSYVEFPLTVGGEKPVISTISFVVQDHGHIITQIKPSIANGFFYESETVGMTDSVEPTWPTTLGATVADGTMIWRAVPAMQYQGIVSAASSRSAFTVVGLIGDFEGESETLGSGASLKALPNGHGRWDGAASPVNVEIVSGGANYVNPIVKAYFIHPITEEPVTFTALQVGLTDGRITYVRFDVTVGSTDEKPVASTVTFSIEDQSETEATAGFFDAGTLLFLDGENAGIEIDIKSFTENFSSWSIELFAPAPFDIGVGVSDGTNVLLKVGCDKRWVTCKNRFHNQNNFRGEPGIPGTDVLYRVNTNS